MRRLLPILILGFATIALTACGDKDKAAPIAAAVPPPAGKQWTEVVVQMPEGYRMGNPNAPVKLVEYGSRLCPACGLLGREAMQPLEQHYVKTGRLNYEFREFLIHGPPDVPMAKLGLCVGPEPFFPVLEQMFVNQNIFLEAQTAATQDQAFVASLQAMSPTAQATAWAEKLGVIAFMKQHGLPEVQARACLNDTKGLEKMVKVTTDASASGLVTGTPTLILNDKKLEHGDAVWHWQELEPILEKRRRGVSGSARPRRKVVAVYWRCINPGNGTATSRQEGSYQPDA